MISSIAAVEAWAATTATFQRIKQKTWNFLHRFLRGALLLWLGITTFCRQNSFYPWGITYLTAGKLFVLDTSEIWIQFFFFKLTLKRFFKSKVNIGTCPRNKGKKKVKVNFFFCVCLHAQTKHGSIPFCIDSFVNMIFTWRKNFDVGQPVGPPFHLRPVCISTTTVMVPRGHFLIPFTALVYDHKLLQNPFSFGCTLYLVFIRKC